MSEQTTPSIYVASLADYNAGRVHGIWIDLVNEVCGRRIMLSSDDLFLAILEMLDESPDPGAEEYSIHEYKGFPAELRLSEHEDLETICAIAQAIESHGSDVVGAYMAKQGAHCIHPETLHYDIAKSYQGHWSSLADYAEELALDVRWPSVAFGSWPFCCIDWGLAGELLRGNDIWIAEEDDHGVHVFNA